MLCAPAAVTSCTPTVTVTHFGFERGRLRLYVARAALNENDHLPGSPGVVPKVLLLGLGNDILTDDAIGLEVAQRLRDKLSDHPGIDIRGTTEMGLALLDFITGYSAVVIVDSIQTGKAAPGSVHELDAGALQQLTGRTPHFVGVSETLALGRELGLAMPEQVKIFAVEVEDPFTLGTELSPALQAALPAIVDRVCAALELMLKS
jgi:hydrogenase maturation protease